MKNKIVESLNRCIVRMVLVGIAVVGLAMGFETRAQAQESFVSKVLYNTAFGTDYYPLGGSNVLVGNGQVLYTGGTNNTTLTNLTSSVTVVSNSAATATSFGLADFQNVPVWWDVLASAGGTGTSNLVLALDLTPDGVNWISQAVTGTFPLTGTSTNLAVVYFPLTNGTNIFSGYTRARWSFAYTFQTNSVSIHANQLQAFTSRSH